MNKNKIFSNHDKNMADENPHLSVCSPALHSKIARIITELNEDLLINTLNFLSDNVIINNRKDVLDCIEQMKKQQIIEEHMKNFKIWKASDGRFKTHLPDESKKEGRRLIAKLSYENLENVIVDFYREREKKNGLSLEKLYPEWLAYKSLHTDSSTYIRRINDDWTRFYKESVLVKKPLDALGYIVLDEWAHKTIREHRLTRKQYYNMSVIIRQSLAYAVTKGYIRENLFERVKIEPKLFRKVKKKPDETQVFMTDEQPKIIDAAFRDFKENNNPNALGIPLLFLLGLRAGELVALKFSDIDEETDGYIHIQRMEVKETSADENNKYHTTGYKVVEHAKTQAGDRNVYIPGQAREILSMLQEYSIAHGHPVDGYVFMTERGRTKEDAMSYRLKMYCKRCGIPMKSLHKIRKTYISTLIDDGNININYIRQQVGHEDERTTYGNYCFNRKTEQENQSDMERALSRI